MKYRIERLCWLSFIVSMLVPLGSWAQDKEPGPKKDKGLLQVEDRLTSDDPKDRVMTGSHCKIYEFRFVEGINYLIRLRSMDFHIYLRLEDSGGRQMAVIHGIEAQIVWQVARDETYRIIATTFEPGKVGPFTLHAAPWGREPAVVPPLARVEGRRTKLADIDIVVEPETTIHEGDSDEVRHGYWEYRFTIHNHSPTERHRVTLTIPENWRTTGHGDLRADQLSVEVPPHSAVPVSLFQPNLSIPFAGSAVDVEIDGRRVQEDRIVIPLHGPREARRERPADWDFARNILTSHQLASGPLTSQVYKSAVDQPSHRSPGGFVVSNGTYKQKPYRYIQSHRFRAASIPIDSWSTSWLGYSRFDGVALTADEFRTAPPVVATALWQYVECGGSLLIVGSCKVPSSWERSKTSLDGLTAYYPGFGQCLVAADTNIEQWEPEQWRPVAAMWEQSAQPWQDVHTPDAANRRFPVVEDQGIPVRGLFIVMLAFTVLIGPVNIYVLTRIKRRILLLLTVPAFSLLTGAAVVGFMVFSEGRHGRVRMEGMTILDETAQRATSVGWLGIYSPLTPTDGLHFLPNTEVTPHLNVRPNTYRRRSGRTIDWTDDQHLASGWVTARVPAHFLVRTSEKRPEHVLVDQQPDGTLTATNTLLVPIRTLWVADADGKISTAADLPAGAKAPLTPTTRHAAGNGAHLRKAYAKNWLLLVKALSAEPELYLRPGCYIAVLESAPFLEPGLRQAGSQAGRSVVFGIMQAR